jgi:hypothetical protein
MGGLSLLGDFMPFAKLDSGIVMSSIWFEPLSTRVLWITMLALKDEYGFVATSRQGLQRAANITKEEFDTAINSLESPDFDSRTPDNEGRRVEKVNGGWIILNNDKYRLHDDTKREKHRIYMRDYRENKSTVNHCEFTVSSHSESESESVSVLKDKKEECKKETKPKQQDETFDMWYKHYPKKSSRGTAEKAWSRVTEKHLVVTLILKALEWQCKQESWTKEKGQYIPMPSTYINGKRWLDEKSVDYSEDRNRKAVEENGF